MSTAIITGITGQDGSYLCELLLSKGYTVHGLVRRSSTLERHRLNDAYRDSNVYERSLFLHYADLSDTTSIRRIVSETKPDEFYHLAGQSHVGLSFEIPESTCELTAMGTLRIMEILRDHEFRPKFLHASSREIFGTPRHSPQDEQTPQNPNSPYGCAKAFATQLVRVYRESHGLFFCNAICYNHESPRRSENFVTRKITLAAARIKMGLQNTLTLGSIESARDWGYAKEFAEAMWMILQHNQPDDYVLATGTSYTVRDFAQAAFEHVGLDWREHVEIDKRYTRPADPESLLGDASKAERVLGWKATTHMPDLVRIMVDHDLSLLQGKQ
ncbi:MAG: GDP-mannose 4,6-dehydratase [Pirellula sp.]